MDPLIYGAVATSCIIGLVTVATKSGLPGRFAPALDVVIGILAGFGSVFGDSPVPGTLLQQCIHATVIGIVMGLTAAKLYEGAGYVGSKVQAKIGVPAATDGSPA